MAVDRGQQRRQRDDGLARPNVTLEQSVHRQRRREVLGDLAQYASLGVRECEVMAHQEPANERRRRVGQRSRPDVEVLDVDGMSNAGRRLLETATSKGEE